MNTLVLFGAGNIGRSFIGQLFSRSGYEVIFVDIDRKLVDALNERRRYQVVIKHPDKADEPIDIENVRAIHALDADAIAQAVADASIVATAVGQRALPAVIAAIAAGLKLRNTPLDIIIAENLHSAANFFRHQLMDLLGKDFPLQTRVGLVETSIGKMVPIMRAEDLAVDPLWVFAEPYNELILDGAAFTNPIPDVNGLSPKQNMAAYVDRKLFIHNLGHCATAYFSYCENPAWDYTYEPLANAGLHAQVKRCMMQSAQALLRTYPDEFTPASLEEHVDDLIARFQNKALGDTVYRVGRDLNRKLSKHDRLIGAMLLAKQCAVPCDEIARAVRAGTEFRKGDPTGALYPDDQRFMDQIYPAGLEHILTTVSGLSKNDPIEAAVIREVMELEQR